VATAQGLRIAPKGEGQPLMAVAYANSGSVIKAGRAVSFLILWGMAESDRGGELGDGEGLSAAIREYAKWARESERTAWRHLGDFRAAFPGEESPANLTAQLRARRVELGRGAKAQAAVGSLAVVA
jgi:hypothetical protein